jgi:hypothetical protein
MSRENANAGNGMTLEEHVELALRKEKARVKRKLYYAILLLVIVYIISIQVFHYIESWSWVDSIYFTTATITTVGYGDITPKTEVGRLFTIPLMLIGIAVGLYAIYAIQEYGKANLGTVASSVGGHLDRVEMGGSEIRGRMKGHVENFRKIGRRK